MKKNTASFGARSKKLKSEEIKVLIRKSKKCQNDSIRLYFLQISTEEKKHRLPIFVYIISSTAIRSAVKRNLLRRRARHIISTHKKNIKKIFFYAFVFGKESNNLPFRKLEQDMIMLFKKINAYA